MERVLVTARRRLETQFDVAGAVTAISGDELRASGITSIQDIMAQVPGASMNTDPTGVMTYISLRGLTQGDLSAEANFGAYRNGMFVGGHRVNLGAQVDVARVEVLRGPQGGLYGRDAVGGAVNIVYAMPRPGDELNGYLTVGVGNLGTTRLEGAITTPVNASLAVRTTVWSNDQRKGDYYNSYLNNWVDHNADRGLRVSAVADLTSELSFEGTAEYQKGDASSLVTYAPNGVQNFRVKSPKETPSTVQRDTDSRLTRDQSYAAAKLIYATKAGTATLQASLRDYKLNSMADLDHTALQPAQGSFIQTNQQNDSVRQRYVEALWESDPYQPFSWRAGLSYFTEDFGIDKNVTVRYDANLISGQPAGREVTALGGLPFPGSSIDTRSTSIFGDMRYQLSKQLAVTATLRYTEDRQKMNWAQGLLPETDSLSKSVFGSAVRTLNLSGGNTYRALAPAAGLEYKFSPTANGYVLYSTAARPGGYNTSIVDVAHVAYGQEKARNYEAGLKTVWLDGRAGLNVAVFRMNQDDLAVQQEQIVPPVVSSYLANVGTALTQGVELEALARPIPSVGLSFIVSYLDSKFTDGLINAGSASAVDLTGKPLARVRPWTLNAQVSYRTLLTPTVQFVGSVGLRREIGGFFGDQSQFAMAPLTNVSLNAGLTFSKKTKLSAYVLNARDTRIEQFRFALGDVATNTGRRYGLQLTREL